MGRPLFAAALLLAFGSGAISEMPRARIEETGEDAVVVPSPVPSPEPARPPAFSPGRYRASPERGRVLIEAEFSVTAETDAWAEVPASFALLSASLDAAPAHLRARKPSSFVRIPAGRHLLRITGTIPLERTGAGMTAAWVPRLSGRIEATGMRLEGATLFDGSARSGASSGSVAAGKEVRFLLAALDAGGPGAGAWRANAAAAFLVGAGRLEARIEIDFAAIGAAPETFEVRLPGALLLASREGEADEVPSPSDRVILRPRVLEGRAILRAEGGFEGETIDLAGLELRGGENLRGELRLWVAPAEGAEVEVMPGAGLAAEGARFRVVAKPYRLTARVRRAEGIEPLKTVAWRADLATTILPDGRRFGQLDLVLAGRSPSSLAVRLPPGAEIQSASVNATPVAPSRSGETILIPLAGAVDGGNVRLVYKTAGGSSLLGGLLEEAPPVFDMPVREAAWSLRLPEGTTIFCATGGWGGTGRRFTPLGLLDACTDAIYAIARFALRITPFLLVLAGIGWLAWKILKKVDWKTATVTGFLIAVGMLGTIFVGCFVALGGPMSNMFSNAASKETLGQGQAAISQTVYGGARDEDRFRAAEAPAPMAEEEAAELVRQERAAPGRRSGGVPIEMEISREGRLHTFRRSDLVASVPLRIVYLGKWPRRLLLLGLALLAGLLARRRPGLSPAGFLGAAVLDGALPGAFAAGGLALVIVIGIDRVQKKVKGR